jgi:methyl-accepting chemotaxis protein
MPLAEAQNQFRQRGGRMMFNKGQGYPIVYNPDTSLLLNGANPQLEGKITGAVDSNGVMIADAIINAGQRSPEGATASYPLPPTGPDRPGSENGLRTSFCAVERHHELWAVRG